MDTGQCRRRRPVSNGQRNKGTSSIVDENTHEPLLPILTLIVDTAVKLRKDGHRVVIVSSGAIGVGLRRMDVAKRPKHLAQLQARLLSQKLGERTRQTNILIGISSNRPVPAD